MRNTKAKKLVSVDERGRVTLPSDIRKGTDTFAVEVRKDGVIALIPQKSVSASEAKILESLKLSIEQMKRGELEDLPEDWT